MTRLYWLLAFLIGCGGTTGNNPQNGNNLLPDMAGAPPVMGQHGIVVDYFSGMPVAGLSVTDGGNSTTTDANGYFLLPAPAGVKLAPVVSGPGYSTLFLPEATADGGDVDRGSIPIPSASTYMLEQGIDQNDMSKALIHITLLKTGACTSIAGGSLQVTSPPGTSVSYFTKDGLPSAQMFTDVPGEKPAADVFNVPPGQDVKITLNTPGCSLAPDDTAVNGQLFTGHVQTMAAEPGDNNSSLVLVLQ